MRNFICGFGKDKKARDKKGLKAMWFVIAAILTIGICVCIIQSVYDFRDAIPYVAMYGFLGGVIFMCVWRTITLS